MRIDLTVRGVDSAAGSAVDVAVFVPPGTPWGSVREQVRSVAGADPSWCGGRRLADDTILGSPPLTTGAVLTTGSGLRPATARLEVVAGPGCGTGVALRPGTLTIGRDPSCDLVLPDATVSRHHAELVVSSGAAVLHDRGSTAGLFVRGTRVRSVALADDEPVRMGRTLLAAAGLGGPRSGDPGDTCGGITVPAPPAPVVATRLPLVATLLPTALGGGLAALTGMWELLVFAALAPVAALASAVGDRSRSRRVARRASVAHRRALARAGAQLADGLRAEGVRRRREFGHPAALLDDPGGTQPLHVRVGLGSAPSRLQRVDGTGRAPAGVVADAPITVDLAAGPVAVAGLPEARSALARWLVAQVVTRASPAEVAVRWDDPAEQRWLRWAPHRDAAGAAARTIGVGASLGDTQIVLVDEAAQAPAGCAVVEVSGDGLVRVRPVLGEPVEAIGDSIDRDLAERLARAAAGRATATGRPGVPARCHLGELLGPTTADRVRARWRADDGSARTVLGVAVGGPVVVDLDRDGPHALIAGCTGSGKSQLLQSLVVGLALGCSPANLSLLLIDFKGGAAFAECARLPHTVGLVTDLDEQLTGRVLASLDAEIRRRERLFAAAGATDLARYRATGHGLERLVIVVDEFAALVDELGAFVPALVGIARRGRSLGLHLVLATQRPAGVVSAEIRANTALRVCLRVTSPADSTDVVDSAVAAAIPAHLPGRAYLRSDAGVREFQVADAAGRYDEQLRVVRLDEHRRPCDTDRAGAHSELQGLVDRLCDAAGPRETAKHRPWLPPLPDRLASSELPHTGPSSVAIGLVDLPAEQRQPALSLDLGEGAVVVVTGDARSGRTTAVLGVVAAATAAHPPRELHVHAIDGTGRALAALRELPHTATVATTDDGFGFTARVAERLAALLGAAASRRARTLVVIDGWDQLVSASDDYDAGCTTERLLEIARLAASGAATVVIAGGRATLSQRLTALAGLRLVLRLGAAGDYQLAGVDRAAVPSRPPPGRAVRVADGAHVQLAAGPLPPAHGGPDHAVARLRPLPRSVELGQLPAGCGRVVLGVAGDLAAPVDVPLAGTVVVAGPPRSGRTTLLRVVLAQAEVATVVAAARSPLASAAAARGVPVVAPTATGWSLPGTGVVLVDDVEQCADLALGDDLARWAATAGHTLVATGRTDALAIGYRGLVAQLRGAGCGVVLHPAPGDADLLGIAIARSREPRPPGRGVLVPDPAWGLGLDPLALQVAVP